MISLMPAGSSKIVVVVNKFSFNVVLRALPAPEFLCCSVVLNGQLKNQRFSRKGGSNLVHLKHFVDPGLN